MNRDRKSTRLNSSHVKISYAVFCLKKKKLDQLHDAHMVACARPGRESGTAPRHWLLRHAGARLVAGTDAAEGNLSAIFFFNDTATTEIYTLSLHDALPI